MDLEIQELTVEDFENKETRKVPVSLGEIYDEVYETLSKRTEEKDYDFLKKLLKEIQNYVLLSEEHIRYIVLCSKLGSSEASSVLFTNFGKHLAKVEMSKFYKFAKLNEIKIDPVLKPSKRWNTWNGNLRRYPFNRVVHQFLID
jgi:hypothetical protein